MSRRSLLKSTAWAVPVVATAVALPRAAASEPEDGEVYTGGINWDRFNTESNPPPSPAGMWWVRTQPIGGLVGLIGTLYGQGPAGVPYPVPGPLAVDGKFSDDPDLLRLDWLDPDPPAIGSYTNYVNWAGVSEWEVLDGGTRLRFTINANLNPDPNGLDGWSQFSFNPGLTPSSQFILASDLAAGEFYSDAPQLTVTDGNAVTRVFSQPLEYYTPWPLP